MTIRCGKCGAEGVRLYRPYGEFRRPERDRCNACLSDSQRKWYVPLIVDRDGAAWGYTSVPPDAVKAFAVLQERDRAGWRWGNRWLPPICRYPVLATIAMLMPVFLVILQW